VAPTIEETAVTNIPVNLPHPDENQPPHDRPYSASLQQPVGEPNAPSAPRRGSSIVKRVGIVAVGLAVAGGARYYTSLSAPESAKAGDCIQKVGENEAKKVECSSADAQFKVLSKVDNVKNADATDATCSSAPTFTHIFWEGPKDPADAVGYVLCLEEITR
jgi:hypothetical protein